MKWTGLRDALTGNGQGVNGIALVRPCGDPIIIISSAQQAMIHRRSGCIDVVYT